MTTKMYSVVEFWISCQIVWTIYEIGLTKSISLIYLWKYCGTISQLIPATDFHIQRVGTGLH
jgi:hypothetical protein